MPCSDTLIHADCLEAMKHIADGSIDLVVTDPPYKVISGGRGEKSTHFSHYDRVHKEGTVMSKNDGKIFKHNDIKIKDYLPELVRVCKPDAHLYIMTNNLNLRELLNQADANNLKLHNVLCWRKNTCTANRWYMKEMELVVMFYKGKAFPINKMNSKQIYQSNNPRDKKHPCEKPVSLIQHYIENSSQPGQTVLDPFMGSGSTASACLNTGRHFIGIEKDDAYFDIAVTRVRTRELELASTLGL